MAKLLKFSQFLLEESYRFPLKNIKSLCDAQFKSPVVKLERLRKVYNFFF